MKHYELVLLLNATLQEKERKDLISGLEKEIEGSILQKYDMGLLTIAHDLGEKKGNEDGTVILKLAKELGDITVMVVTKLFL